MFNFKKTAIKTAAALLVAGTLSGQANEASAQGFLDLNGCIGDRNFKVCFDTNSGGGSRTHGYPRGHYGYERKAVEIDRVPYSARCPRGTDTESILSNRYPGTRERTRVCQVYEMVPKRN